jgi:hypothetical protein
MNRPPNLVRTLGLTLLTLALGGLSACGVDEADTTEAEEGALVIQPGPGPTGPLPPYAETCPARPADAALNSDRYADTVYSPTKYGTSSCPKAYVVDISPISKYSDHQVVFVFWGDQWARNEMQCTGGTLKVDFWSSAYQDLWPRKEGSFEVPLKWDAQKQYCDYGFVELHHELFASPDYTEAWWAGINYGPLTNRDPTPIRFLNGRTIRVVASALSPGGGSTQPLHFIVETWP